MRQPSCSASSYEAMASENLKMEVKVVSLKYFGDVHMTIEPCKRPNPNFKRTGVAQLEAKKGAKSAPKTDSKKDPRRDFKKDPRKNRGPGPDSRAPTEPDFKDKGQGPETDSSPNASPSQRTKDGQQGAPRNHRRSTGEGRERVAKKKLAAKAAPVTLRNKYEALLQDDVEEVEKTEEVEVFDEFEDKDGVKDSFEIEKFDRNPETSIETETSIEEQLKEAQIDVKTIPKIEDRIEKTANGNVEAVGECLFERSDRFEHVTRKRVKISVETAAGGGERKEQRRPESWPVQGAKNHSISLKVENNKMKTLKIGPVEPLNAEKNDVKVQNWDPAWAAWALLAAFVLFVYALVVLRLFCRCE